MSSRAGGNTKKLCHSVVLLAREDQVEIIVIKQRQWTCLPGNFGCRLSSVKTKSVFGFRAAASTGPREEKLINSPAHY